jgi:hypothetical protein
LGKKNTMRKWLLAATLLSACAPGPASPSGSPPPGASLGAVSQAGVAPAVRHTAQPGEVPSQAPLELPTEAPTQAPIQAVATSAPEQPQELATLPPAIAELLPTQAQLPTPQPTAIPTPSLVGPVAGIHEGGVVFAKDNVFGVPASIGVGGPAGLLGAGANKYALMAAGSGAPTGLLLLDVLPYFATRLLVDGILAAAFAAQLEVGRDYVFGDNDKPGKFLTVRVEVLADHAQLSVWRGKLADPSRQIVSIRWTDARHGRAVFRTLSNDDEPKRTALATTFDRQTGAATVDMVVDDPHGSDTGNAQQSATHLELRAYENPREDQPAFSVRSGLVIHKAEDPNTPSRVGVAANWLPDGRGAYWVALGSHATQDKLLFWPVNPLELFKSPPGAHDFYVDKLGLELPRLLAGPKLKAVVPPDADLPGSFPADPGVGAPFDDPKLAMGS